MIRGRLSSPSYRPQFSGHETFPLRHLWLRKAYEAVKAQCHDGHAPRAIFSDPDAIARFGVGKNMVGAIRHWAVTCNIITETRFGYQPTPLAELLFGDGGVDPYLEHPATVWLTHWIVAGRASRSTTWYWAFNCVSSQTFDREALTQQLLDYCEQLPNNKISPSTVKRDVECFIRSYVPRAGATFAEELTEPLLGELGLIQSIGRSVFAFKRGPKPTLPDSLFLYALLEFWKDFSTTKSLPFEAIAYEAGSPGRVFKLDEDAVAERLSRMEQLTEGAITASDTAGLRQIVQTTPIAASEIEILKGSYARTTQRRAA